MMRNAAEIKRKSNCRTTVYRISSFSLHFSWWGYSGSKHFSLLLLYHEIPRIATGMAWRRWSTGRFAIIQFASADLCPRRKKKTEESLQTEPMWRQGVMNTPHTASKHPALYSSKMLPHRFFILELYLASICLSSTSSLVLRCWWMSATTLSRICTRRPTLYICRGESHSSEPSFICPPPVFEWSTMFAAQTTSWIACGESLQHLICLGSSEWAFWRL